MAELPDNFSQEQVKEIAINLIANFKNTGEAEQKKLIENIVKLKKGYGDFQTQLESVDKKMKAYTRYYVFCYKSP